MRAKQCLLILNNRWGYVYTPQRCKSKAEARRIAQEAISDVCLGLQNQSVKLIGS